VASDPGDRDIGVRGFQQQRKFCIADSRSAKSRSDVAGGTTTVSGVQVEAHRSSGFGDS
jgi:hypothetical protein